MTEALLFKLLDIGFTAVSVGLEREAVLTKAREMQNAGSTPEEIADALIKMRDDAIAEAQKQIDSMQ